MSQVTEAVEPHDPVKSNFDFDNEFRLNTTDETLLENVKVNIRRQLPQLLKNPQQSKPVAIVAGGWSLEETLDELVELWWNDTPIIALNGAGNYLIERNIRPAVVAVLDAREMNVSFVENDIQRCKYLLASQCHPSLFDKCEDREVYIYHVESSDAVKEELESYYFKLHAFVPGGSTIGLRAISLAHLMGFRDMHFFGMDSCYQDERHHAYEQEWNNGETVAPLICGGRRFMCSGWQMSQAKQFVRFVQSQGQHFNLHMHGDGLLAHIIKTGANLLEGED